MNNDILKNELAEMRYIQIEDHEKNSGKNFVNYKNLNTVFPLPDKVLNVLLAGQSFQESSSSKILIFRKRW